MDICIAAATPFEIAPTLDFLRQNFSEKNGFFEKNGLRVLPVVTGVGMVSTTFLLTQIFSQNHFNLNINAGIAGTFDETIEIGEVVNVVSERFGDLGVEEKNGTFSDLFDLGLLELNSPPFIYGTLQNPAAGEFSFLKKVQGLTVNKVHGSAASIRKIKKKYPEVQVETMEGAAFFYNCLLADVKFLEIRSISNRVEPRNRAAWDLPQAIQNLNEVLLEMLERLTFSDSK